MSEFIMESLVATLGIIIFAVFFILTGWVFYISFGVVGPLVALAGFGLLWGAVAFVMKVIE